MKIVYGIDILPNHRLGIEKYKRLRIIYRVAEKRSSTDEEIMEIVEMLESFEAKVGAWNL